MWGFEGDPGLTILENESSGVVGGSTVTKTGTERD